MSFDPTFDDLDAMDAFLERVLDAYKRGRIDRKAAVSVLAHVIIAAAIDNEREFKSFIRLRPESHPRD
jgi:hypothetical protein